ncbi:MAG: hypothetical protein JW818_03260 [Pirellulales bacterium]|nr:hypothetical protein [Pirellulales bacterium]
MTVWAEPVSPGACPPVPHLWFLAECHYRLVQQCFLGDVRSTLLSKPAVAPQENIDSPVPRPSPLAPSFILLLTLTFATGCWTSNDPAPLVVLASGDTGGRIVPCGCTSNQSGGLPRRATLVERLRGEAQVVVVEVGGAPAGTSVYDRIKFEAILRGEKAMGIAAHNIGEAEAAFGPDVLMELANQTGVPFISANVLDAEGQPVAPAVRLIEKAGRRLAVIGVLSQRFAAPGLTVRPPREAVLETLREVKGKFDTAIVLAYLPEDELRELAQALPEVDVVLGGPTGQPIVPKRQGPTLLSSATNEGKFVIRLDLPEKGPAGAWSGSVVELDESFADDSCQVENVKQFYEELGRRDLTPEETSLVKALPTGLPDDYRVAGTTSCFECHEEEAAVWRKSRHAHAWQSLEKKGAHVDPACQRCHTVGYGLPGGFRSVTRSPKLTNVGCEDCHGPSLAHVKKPETYKTTYGAGATDRCTVCHDQENSPRFDYSTYWPQIQHGVPAAEGTEPKTKMSETDKGKNP